MMQNPNNPPLRRQPSRRRTSVSGGVSQQRRRPTVAEPQYPPNMNGMSMNGKPAGKNRRMTFDGRSKSYADIRQAYNIPDTPGTLPPGVAVGRAGGGNIPNSKSYGDLLTPGRNTSMRVGGNGSRQRDHDMATAGDNMSLHSNNSGVHTAKMANSSGVTRSQKMKRVQSCAALGSFKSVGEGYAADVSDRDIQPPGKRNPYTNGARRLSVSEREYSSGGSNNKHRRKSLDALGSISHFSDPENSGGGPRIARKRSTGYRRGSSGSGDDLGGRRGSFGLKSLPEHESFRESNRGLSVADSLDDSAMESSQRNPFQQLKNNNANPQQRNKDLNSMSLEEMSLEELRSELRMHGINVEGSYECNDLMNICSQQRSKKEREQMSNSYRPVRGASNNNGPNRRRSMSKDDGMPRRNSFSKVEHIPLNDASSHSAQQQAQRTGRRRTVDSKDSLGNFSAANPQQGMNNSYASGSNLRRNSGTRSVEASAVAGAPRGNSLSRRDSRSSMSSLGDPDLPENEMEVAVLNAPLGVGLSGVGHDVENPNQQMGLLLQQMQQLEEQMNSPQDRKIQRRPSSAALSAKSKSSRRMSMSTGSNNTWFFGGVTPGGSANTSHRSGLNASMHSGLSREETFNTSNDSGLNNSNNGNGTPKKPGDGPLNPTQSDSITNKALGVQNGLGGLVAAGEEDESGLTSPTFNNEQAKNSYKNKKKPFFSKKRIIMGVFLLIVVGGALAASLLFALNDSPNDNDGGGVGGLPTDDGLGAMLATRSPTQSPLIQVVEAPPSDIEGRCSPSNLPGSLSACLAACMPSACCYPNYNSSSSKKVCISKDSPKSIDACNRYRPYCDIFYDTWQGATDGVLRTPPTSIVQMCSLMENNSSSGSIGSGERPLSTTTESFQRKRLRNSRIDDDSPSKATSYDTPDQICQRHCKSARCCHAPVYAAGLIVSASGVYTDIVRGDHVVTNCQDDYGENRELCTKYDTFCSDNEYKANESWINMPTDLPEEAPKPSIAPSRLGSNAPSYSPSENVFLMAFSSTPPPTVTSSPTLTLLPSSMPSHTSLPSMESPPSSPPTTTIFPTVSQAPSVQIAPTPKPIIPPASSLEIAEACSGAENVELIAMGILSARTKCIDACQEGLCCYSNEFGYSSWMQSCYDENQETCLEYYPCLVLVEGKEVSLDQAVGPNGTVVDEDAESVVEGDEPNSSANTTSNSTFNAERDGPPTPSQNLTLICSQDSLSTTEGLDECASACEPASCCDVQNEGEASCYSNHTEICGMYQPCMNIVEVLTNDVPANNVAPDEEQQGTTISSQLPPQAEEDPQTTNPSTVTENPTVATEEPTEPTTAVEEPTVVEEREPPPPASAELSTMCSYESLASGAASGVQCFEQCRPADCCWDGTCSGDVCDTYLPCHNLELMRGPPSNLNQICNQGTNSVSDECGTICSKVSCCFIGSSYVDGTFYVNTELSPCFALFRDTCIQYASFCAPPPEPIVVPPPPSDLVALCAFSKSFCESVCDVASCCFQSSTEPSCLADNEEVCATYNPCSVLYD